MYFYTQQKTQEAVMNFGDYKFGDGNDDPWGGYEFSVTNSSSQPSQQNDPGIFPPVDAEHESFSVPFSGSLDTTEPKNDHYSTSPSWSVYPEKEPVLETPQPQISRPESPKLTPATPAPELKQSAQLVSSTAAPVEHNIPQPVQPASPVQGSK